MTDSVPPLEISPVDESLSVVSPPLPLHIDIWQETLGWCPSDRQQQEFRTLYHQILVGNQTLNLTRITQPDEFWEKHLWDSLSGIHFLLPDQSTESPTDPSAESPTESPTDPSTESPTDSSTESPTDPSAESPTESPTDPSAESFTDPSAESPTDPSAESLTESPPDPSAESPTENIEHRVENSNALNAESPDENPSDQYDGSLPETLSIPNNIERVLDIGTGAGFPGLPVAIACPHWQLTLLDSTRKKISFIDSILPQLGLTNVRTFTHRAETLGRNSHHRYQYDLVLIRAVAAATVCAEYVLPFLKVGGQGILYRGRWTEVEEECLLYALDILGGTIEAIYQWETPLSQGDRHCIVIRKIEKTPRFFPRDIGIPAKDPLA